MAGLIDTNVLLYGANSSAPEHLAAASFLTEAGRSTDQWYLTDGILYEFLRVSTHPRVFPHPLVWSEALGFLRPFIDSPRFAVLQAGSKHWELVAGTLVGLTHPSGNLFFDVRTAVLMREHGVRTIYTTDSDFLQFPSLKVVNPLAG